MRGFQSDWWQRTHDSVLGQQVLRASADPVPGRLPQNAGRLRVANPHPSLPIRSRKPGGKFRAGQRSGDRKIPVPTIQVNPYQVLSAFQRRWRGKYREPGLWRVRGLAVIAVAMSLPPDRTIESLAGMLPHEVLQLMMPAPAWRWVLKWLGIRRAIEGPASDREPWLGCGHSRGMPRQISWAATRTLDRAGLPGWRLTKLLRAGWAGYSMPVRFYKVARRLVPWESPLRNLACEA